MKYPMTVNDKKYVRYIQEHRLRVAQAWDELQRLFPGYSFVSESRYSNVIMGLINTHDLSKYRDEEFDPYRLHWYPEAGEAPDEEGYNRAWEHHVANNPHHYLYWKGKEFDTEKDLPYLIEMICDWQSVSRLTGAQPSLDWFEENIEEIQQCLPQSAIVVLRTLLTEIKRITGR